MITLPDQSVVAERCRRHQQPHSLGEYKRLGPVSGMILKYHFKNSSNINLFNASCVYGGTRTIQVYDNATAGLIDQTVPSGTELFITCESDNEQLNYSGNKRLKVGLEYEFYVNADGDDDNDFDSTVYLQFILEDKPLELNAINDSFD